MHSYFQGLFEEKSRKREHGQSRVMLVCLEGDECDFLAQVYNGLSICSRGTLLP